MANGNQLLENMSAQTQKQIGDFFSGGNSAKQAKTQQSGETDCEKQSADGKARKSYAKQEGQDGPVSLHWLIREIHSYQTLHYLGIGLKHKTPYKD